MTGPHWPARPRLEQRVRLLLHAYPTGYRTSRGDEIVATVLEAARPGQRMPHPADAADLVRAGLRVRLAAVGPAFAAGARVAAPYALALAAGVSAYLWSRVEPTTVHKGWSYQTLGPVAYMAWVLALAVRVVLPAALSRPAVIGAMIVTAALPAAAAPSGIDRPPLWTLSLLLALGAVTLAIGPPTMDERVAVAAGAVAIGVVAATLRQVWPPPPDAAGYYQPREVGAVVAATAALLLALAIRRPAPSRPVQARAPALTESACKVPLLAPPAGVAGAVLLAVPVTWLGPYASVPPFGRLAQVLLGSCVAAVALFWLARRGSVRPHPDAGTSGIFSATVGVAVGLALFLIAAGASPYAWWTVSVVGSAGLLGLLTTRRLLAAAGGLGLVGGLVAAWAVGVYANSWTLTGWGHPEQTAQLVATIAFIPLSACAVAAARGSERRVGRWGTVAVCLVWLVPATLPYALSWGPQLAVLLACLGVSAMSRPVASLRR